MAVELVNSDDRYIWMDLESTGLDPQTDCILQIAAIATNGMLQEIDTFESIVAPIPSSLENMNDYVRNMHTENGLLESILAGNPPSVQSVGDRLYGWLCNIQSNNGNTYLVGNSLHSVDWAFTKHFIPKLYMNHEPPGPLHYRIIDITGLRLALQMWTGYNFNLDKKKTHLAMDDIKECIEEFKYLRSCTSDYFSGLN